MEYGLWHNAVSYNVLSATGLNPCSNGIWSLTSWGSCCCSDSPEGLNPCSNGIWSLTIKSKTNCRITESLNPCSNGIWSLTDYYHWVNNPCNVLILVLMEYGLWPNDGVIDSWKDVRVLILVLMEYGLWPLPERALPARQRLNPCSNGIWSLTSSQRRSESEWSCLNPCSNGIWSLTMPAPYTRQPTELS